MVHETTWHCRAHAVEGDDSRVREECIESETYDATDRVLSEEIEGVIDVNEVFN